MTAKTLAKTLVTVSTVRAANGRMMSSSTLATPTSTPSVRVASKIRDVDTAGRKAMQSLQKK